MAELVVVRRGTFLDSVSLMMASNDAAALDRIEEASILNATPLNLELIGRQGFEIDVEDGKLGPNDLVIALRGEEAALDAALSRIDEQLRSQGEAEPAAGARRPARSVTAAAARRGDLNLALISVPGQHATYECARALDAGLDVFCFSSGPSIGSEAALKQRALERGLMLMGPDCGTAILGGVAVGFGNAARPGPVGIVGASGTGIQAITCLLDAAGVGISHAIGVGGRDLSAAVGGRMALRAVELLSEDAGTETIVVVAKSPDAEVAERVAGATRLSGKQVALAFPGLSAEPEGLPELSGSLEEAAAAAAASVGAELPAGEPLGEVRTTAGAICGLFSGGTLRDEARGIIAASVGRVDDELSSETDGRHAMVDLGDERFTQGRAHPMIDLTVRTTILDERSRDPGIGVVLLDVVLGYGAHPDPAAELATTIAAAVERRQGDLSVIVSLCGTEGDPQGLEAQAERLHRAGAVVTRSNAQAARLALAAAGLEEARR